MSILEPQIPSFAALRLGILQFNKVGDERRIAVLWTDENVELYTFDVLEHIVGETYDLWREVLDESRLILDVNECSEFRHPYVST